MNLFHPLIVQVILLLLISNFRKIVMTKYLLRRLLHGLISVIIVVAVVMLLIYSLTDREKIFGGDPVRSLAVDIDPSGALPVYADQIVACFSGRIV